MGNLFGRGSRKEEEQGVEEQLAELVRKVERLEEARREAADNPAHSFSAGLEALLENVVKLRVDLEQKLESLDKREEEMRGERERLRQWEEALKERGTVLDDRERRSRREREAEERGEDAGEEAVSAAEGMAEQETIVAESAETGTETAGAVVAGAVEKRLEELAAAVSDSAYKDNLIKELHAELQRHRQGMLADIAKPYLRSVMKIHERLWDTARYYARKEVRTEEGAYDRFLRKVESDVLAVQDMLEDDFGVSYFEAEAGGEFLPREYHVLKTVTTTDASQAGRVAECLYGGFRSEETGKVVKAAQVVLYKLEKENK